MTEPAASCCNSQTGHGGFTSADVSALDVLAVKLHCLDSGFAAPLRQIATVFGERMANARFLRRAANEARFQIAGCGEVYGPIPRVGRSVCGFNAGVFGGFLRAVTGQPWTVEETACLGLGDGSCEFLSVDANGGREHGG